MQRIALLFVMLAGLLASPTMAQDFPELTGQVVDEANIIPADVEAQLVQQLAALEDQSQRQMVVVTVPSLQGYDEQTFTYQLGRHWGIGDSERDDGLILLVAPEERKVRIEVGYGLEGIMTDALSAIIIQNEILPRFRDGDMPAGILAGTDAIMQQLVLPEDEARLIAQQAGEQRQTDGGFPIGGLIWLGFIFFFFILPMLRGRGRRRRYGRRGLGDTASDIILWEVGSAIARGAMSGGSDGGSSWGGGGGFGGGFSGGGGSFGGGGASGGW